MQKQTRVPTNPATKSNSDKIMEAIAECDYIHSIDWRAPGKSFNNDTDCFMRYVQMQANSFARDGFDTIAKDLHSFVTSVALIQNREAQ
jgi:hypothetical protein